MNYSHYSRTQRELKMHNKVVRQISGNIKAPSGESWKKMYDVTDRTFSLHTTPPMVTPARKSNKAMYRYKKNIPPAIPEVVMINKSCMTGRYYENFDKDISQLMQMFPYVSQTQLAYRYNKYNRDLNHTIEFFLYVKEKVDRAEGVSNGHVGTNSGENEPKKWISMETDHEEVNVEVAKDEIMELNLGANFVSQLENLFGDPNLPNPQGLQPVVQVPRSLAIQLYESYVDSVYQQLESRNHVLEMENQEFARNLNRDQDQYREQASRDMNPATMFSSQMLLDAFPTIPEGVLLEVLYVHNDNYKASVDTLLYLTGYENINGIVGGAPTKEVSHEMKVAQQINDTQGYVEATFYRAEALKYFKRRSELMEAANQYQRSGFMKSAQFFFDLSNLQSEYFVKANRMAATAFLKEHSRRLQDFNTLDLHFLYVKEAILALDAFLDRNISLLKQSEKRTHEYLQIITGRGNRSENGISKIKPAVKARLKERNIDCVELNPGKLKVRITRASEVTKELSKT